MSSSWRKSGHTDAVLLPGPKTCQLQVNALAAKKHLPAVIVHGRTKHPYVCTTVEIMGPSQMIQSDTPNANGAHVWIETFADIVTDDDWSLCPKGR
jgi:hypothetical protein